MSIFFVKPLILSKYPVRFENSSGNWLSCEIISHNVRYGMYSCLKYIHLIQIVKKDVIKKKNYETSGRRNPETP